jgi:hypothetical protein
MYMFIKYIIYDNLEHCSSHHQERTFFNSPPKRNNVIYLMKCECFEQSTNKQTYKKLQAAQKRDRSWMATQLCLP